jgi:hypothetical protein
MNTYMASTNMANYTDYSPLGAGESNMAGAVGVESSKCDKNSNNQQLLRPNMPAGAPLFWAARSRNNHQQSVNGSTYDDAAFTEVIRRKKSIRTANATNSPLVHDYQQRSTDNGNKKMKSLK